MNARKKHQAKNHVQPQTEIQPQETQEEPLKQAQDVRLRFIGVIHPFFITHNLRNEHGAARLREKTASGVGDSDYKSIMEELVSAKKMLEKINAESKNPSSTLIYVSSEIHRSEYEKIRDTASNKVFDDEPEKTLDEANEAVLARMGVRTSYDESWLLASSIRAFGADRVIFTTKNLNMDDIYRRYAKRAMKAQVTGLFMGTYSGQCVSNNRNLLCDALNIPYSRVTVGKKHGVDAWWPHSHERKNAQEEFLQQASGLTEDPREREMVARGFYRSWARGEIRHYRGQALVEGSGYTILSRPFVKTYLKPENQREFERIFGKYRLSRLEEMQKNAGENPLGELKPNFPPRGDAAAEIAYFLNGWKLSRDSDSGTPKPWDADSQEIQKFRLKLAKYLAGREITGRELPGFAGQYREKIRELAETLSSREEK